MINFVLKTKPMTSDIVYLSNLRTRCTHIQSNNQIETDAPIDNNGSGNRFSPTDLVATALASCMITVMGIKANQMGISFKDVSASVVKKMAANPRRISSVSVVLTIGDIWNDREREIMENTAKSCPVSKSLSPDLEQHLSFFYK